MDHGLKGTSDPNNHVK